MATQENKFWNSLIESYKAELNERYVGTFIIRQVISKMADGDECQKIMRVINNEVSSLYVKAGPFSPEITFQCAADKVVAIISRNGEVLDHIDMMFVANSQGFPELVLAACDEN